MYTDATSIWKDERLRRRQNEIILDQVAPFAKLASWSDTTLGST